MKRTGVCCQRLVIAIFAISALVVSSVVAFAEGSECVQGKQSEKELSQEWVQLMNSLPSSVNPVLDDAGEYCVVGQRGDVWFLAGTFSGTQTTRTCTVPENKVLFFPVINNFQFDSPNLCGQDANSLTVKEMRANVSVDAATNLSVTLDDKKVRNIHRVTSDVFDVSLPEDNIYTYFGITPCPPGSYSPAVADGYYASVGPLKPGQHTLHIYAESSGFVVDVTYILNVVPVKLK